ncbi:MAG: molybdenum cofactor guanylyltransferase [Clostridia bacterium]|nr:molybdenum cofactor guanylyltransferase [Clostridia bacterium]MDY5555208.1 molybdenum cofactor guanylyltransferase [Blautia sp.]
MKRQDMYSLLLLAGGRSSRMGKDKAELLFEGKTFISILLEKAKTLGIKKIYLSGHRSTLDGIKVISDIYQDRGPLGGIHACMCAMSTPYCLVLPVDVPQIPSEELEKLIHYHECLTEYKKNLPILLEHNERVEPLIGIYPTEIKGIIEEVIKNDSAPVFRVLKKWGYNCFHTEISGWKVENINTPEAYQELLTHQEGDTFHAGKN